MANEHANIRIRELSRKLMEGTISPKEEEELTRWLNHDDGETLDIPADFAASREIHEKRIKKAISDRIRPNRTQRRLIITSAAAAVLLVAMIAYQLFTPSAIVDKKTSIAVTDPLPAGNKAVLTLGNGDQVILDDMATGARLDQAIKEDSGMLSYQHTTSATVQINTLATPRGGKFTITLPDGTRVWLNAASKLTYPTAFDKNERTVELVGQAYFEVAQMANQPFHVKAGGLHIKVLGTSFDIMAYPDEKHINTTLVTGSVQVINGLAIKQLKPQQQAVADLNTGTLAVKTGNIDKTLAWKNGLFIFNDADFEGVLREISRWYDIEFINLAGNSNELYGGSISRNAKLSDVLKLLSTASSLHFKTEGRQVTILP
ncbi:FecR family protein [Chitinophaga agri]|uniref:DUF4974 domain-containing protein n=1 Tax=Chitinophaga agri TaxID=2703787 RepID=A0A6B9ZN92_9BACT|nr:FecR family protein [Chitinophaga agri]QHS63758.1 DUF4974 domain-containing protein [Chitinophaga agri]